MKAYSLLKQQMDFDELEAMYNRMRPNEEE
jgi:hypothetical protein